MFRTTALFRPDSGYRTLQGPSLSQRPCGIHGGELSVRSRSVCRAFLCVCVWRRIAATDSCILIVAWRRAHARQQRF